MKEDYILIKQAVSPEICDFLSEYACFKAQSKPNIKKDLLAQVHREYGDPLMEMLLAKLTPQIEKAVECALWPTLSFYYFYPHGSFLPPHKDRSSCQYTAGLCIGADKKFKENKGTWPLILKVKEKSEVIAVDYGDILIFKGYETEHWRAIFQGEWFVSAIFAYVAKEGPYAFQKFDQRKALNTPHVGMFWWMYGVLKNKIFCKK